MFLFVLCVLVQDSLVDQPQAEGTFPIPIISLIVIYLSFRRLFISLTVDVCVISALDYNQLLFFVLANIVTGTVNILFDTLHSGTIVISCCTWRSCTPELYCSTGSE